MSQDWTVSLPSAVVFVIGLGALAGAVLAILKPVSYTHLTLPTKA